MRNDIKAMNGIGPGAGKGARAEATHRELVRYLRNELQRRLAELREKENDDA